MSKRRLAIILFADIAGYTARMQQDESLAKGQLQAFREAMQTQVAAHNGEIVHFYGDGCLVLFELPRDAAQASIALQKNFQAGEIPVRIGIHSGTVNVDEDHVYGDAINVASRVESMSVPGAVLLSKRVRDELKNQAQFQLQSLGDFAFKNVEDPMGIFALANEGLSVPRSEEMKGKGEIVKDKKPSSRFMVRAFSVGFLAMLVGASLFWIYSANQLANEETAFKEVRASRIAVLPFENLTNDADLDVVGKMAANWIADGLMSIEDINVVSAGNVRSHLYTTSLNPEDSANEAFASATGAEKLIVGSMYKSRDSLILKSKVVDALSGKIKNAFPAISGPVNDPTRLVEELMQRILTYYAIDENTHASIFSKMKAGPPKLAAFEAFSRGLDAFGVDYREALRNFRQAQELDESFLAPYLWTISSFANQSRYREADSVLALTKEQFPLPNSFEQSWLIWYETIINGNEEDQYHATKKVHSLDPKDPTVTYLAGLHAFQTNRVQECAMVMETINLESSINNPNIAKSTINWLYRLHSESLIRLKRFEEAREKLNAFPRSFYTPQTWAQLAKVAVFLHEPDSLKPIIERAHFEGGEAVIYAEIGKAYALLGDKKKQVEWFQKAIDWHLSQGKTTEVPHRYYQYAGLPEEALTRFQKQLQDNPSLSDEGKVFRLMKIGLLQAQLGNEAKAQQTLDQLDEFDYPYSDGWPTYAKAVVLANMGQKVASIQALKRAFREGEGFYWNGRYYADLDLQPLWDEPDFVDFVRPRD